MATYKFKKPWNFGSETVTEVEIKESYTAGDIRKIKNARKVDENGNLRDQGDFEFALIVVGTGYTPTQAEMIPGEDWDDLVVAIANFIPHGKSGSES